jgi:branched-chain amino acid aminotransferase
MSDLLCSVDGRIGPLADATISIADDGFLRGDGAFEMLRIYGGAPFALEDHMDRMERSAAGIFLEWDRATFEAEIAALLEANPEREAALRLVLSRGGRRIAIIERVPDFQHGLSLSTVEYQTTIVLTGLKTLSYGGNMLATRLAQRNGADDALLARPDGTLLEAPTSTIFWVDSDGVLHTPALESGVLASITRQRIMDMVPCRESAAYRLADIQDAEEVFLASSLREVQGVRTVDGLDYACPGPVTLRIAGLLSERVEAEIAQARTAA